jgi:hypothetical protein
MNFLWKGTDVVAMPENVGEDQYNASPSIHQAQYPPPGYAEKLNKKLDEFEQQFGPIKPGKIELVEPVYIMVISYRDGYGPAEWFESSQPFNIESLTRLSIKIVNKTHGEIIVITDHVKSIKSGRKI